MSAPDRPGIFPDVPDTDYHADRGSLSSTGARLLLPPSCPAKFREAMDSPRKPKAVFDFGTVTHRLVLGAGADIVAVDAPDWRTKDAREARDQAYADGCTPILAADLQAAQRCADAVLSHPVAGPLFVDGRPEVSLYADDPVTGVRLRARVDWMTGDAFDPGRLWMVDVKTSTTAHPDVFARKATDYGYHVQAAFYLRVARLLGLGAEADPAFVFVVVEKEPPHLVSVVAYDDDAMREGDRLVTQAINLYASCVETGDWPPYTGTDTIVPISLPRWALRDGIQADADQIIAELEGITSS